MTIDVGQFSTPVFFTGASGASNAISSAATGSSFLVFVSTDGTQTVTSVTDNKGNTPYAIVGSTLSNFLGAGVSAVIYLFTNGVGGSGHTATANLTGSADAEVYLLEVVGGVTASLVDALSSAFWNDDSATPFTSNNVVTTNATDLLLAFTITGSTSGTETLTWSNSFSQVVADGNSAHFTTAIAKQIVSTTGTYNSSFTSSGAGTTECATAVIALKGIALTGQILMGSLCL